MHVNFIFRFAAIAVLRKNKVVVKRTAKKGAWI